MLLQALVACAGVTLRAVATSLQIPITGGTVHAEGDLDFRGTLAVSKDAPVGFTAIRLGFDLDTDASDEHEGVMTATKGSWFTGLTRMPEVPAAITLWAPNRRRSPTDASISLCRASSSHR